MTVEARPGLGITGVSPRLVSLKEGRPIVLLRGEREVALGQTRGSTGPRICMQSVAVTLTLNVEKRTTLITGDVPSLITDPTAATVTTIITITDTREGTLLEVTVKTTADVAASTTTIITTTTTTTTVITVAVITVITMVRIVTVTASGLITTIRRMIEKKAPVTTVAKGRVVPPYEGGNIALNPGVGVGRKRGDLDLNLEMRGEVVGLSAEGQTKVVRMLRVRLLPVRRSI